MGTALDNATESVETEPDHEKRLIRVAVYAQNGFVMLRFETTAHRKWSWARTACRAATPMAAAICAVCAPPPKSAAEL